METLTHLLSDPALAFPIRLTLKACAASAVLFVLVALPLAYYTAKRDTIVSKTVLFICTLPLIFPPVALGYLLLLVFRHQRPRGSVSQRDFRHAHHLFGNGGGSVGLHRRAPACDPARQDRL